MNHIEVLKKYLEREQFYLHQAKYEPIDSEEIRILIKWNTKLIKEKIEALSHAIKCCEIVDDIESIKRGIMDLRKGDYVTVKDLDKFFKEL